MAGTPGGRDTLLSALLDGEEGNRIVAAVSDFEDTDVVVAPGPFWERLAERLPARRPHWADEAGALSGHRVSNRRVLVVAATAEEERAQLDRATTLGFRAAFGLFRHVLPAVTARAGVTGPLAAPRKVTRYALMSIPRTGSAFLCAMLARSGVGYPLEHLRDPAALVIARAGLPFSEWLEASVAYGQREGIYGTKIISHFLINAAGHSFARLEAFCDVLHQRGFALIRLRRRIIDAAVSGLIAAAGQRWHVYSDNQMKAFQRSVEGLDPPERAVEHYLCRYLAEDCVLNALLSERKVEEVSFEEVISRPNDVISRLTKRIGVPPDRGPSPEDIGIPRPSRGGLDVYWRVEDRVLRSISQEPMRIRREATRMVARMTGLGDAAAARLCANYLDSIARE